MDAKVNDHALLRSSAPMLQFTQRRIKQRLAAMPTTTIRLPEDLKARVAAVADRTGKTAHSFILEAIAEKAAQEERRADFNDVADQRYAKFVASGKSIPWQEMKRYLEGRLQGATPARPAARKFSR